MYARNARTVAPGGKVSLLCELRLQLIMELDNCNAHGDQENTGPNTPQHDNDPSGNKKWYRQASQRSVNAPFNTCVHLRRLYVTDSKLLESGVGIWITKCKFCDI